MRDLAEIHAIAAACKSGEAVLAALLARPRLADGLEAEPDHRWLAAFARALFQAGFSRKAIAVMLDNAVFLHQLAAEHGGGAGPCLARRPYRDCAGSLDLLKSGGARLGGATSQTLAFSTGE